uniref:Uncharacterized protein n=1 Tax=viral metagenome TaxID=1070528 RepID=A0A6C0EF40_9ZZZZ
MDTITVIGATFVLFYCVIQVFSFYNIPPNVYIIYLIFYIFIVITFLILGNK